MNRRAALRWTVGWIAAGSALARAQPRPRRVAVLSFAGADLANALRRELAALGYRDRLDIVIEARSADGRNERLPALADELVKWNPDVLVANTTPAVHAAAAATRAVPIVMAVAGDALATGHVQSLARPGGNLTGLSLALIELAGKTVSVLRDAVPRLGRLACVVHRDDPLHKGFLAEAEASAQRLRLDFVPVLLQDATAELDVAFATANRHRADGMMLQPIVVVPPAQRKRIIELQQQYRMPAISGLRRFADDGGFVAYASEFPDVPRRAAGYVDRILRGATPGELPIERPTRFDLVINRQTAAGLGIVIPPAMLAQAQIV